MKRVREFTLAAFGSALWWLTERLLDSSVTRLMETVARIAAHLTS